MYNFAALWVRLIGIVLVVVLGLAVILILGRKRLNRSEKIIITVLVLGLVLLGGSETAASLIKPEIKTVDVIFEKEGRSSQRIFLESEYCFAKREEKIYLELDVMSKNIIMDHELVEGEEYRVSYEAKSNLILSVSKQ